MMIKKVLDQKKVITEESRTNRVRDTTEVQVVRPEEKWFA